MSFDRDWRGRSNDDSEQNERTRRARAQPQTQGGTRPHQYLSSVLRPSPEQAAQLDRLIQTRGFEQVQRWGERGELPEGCNTPTGEQVRVARVRSSLGAGVELDTESAMRSVEAQAESDLAGETATPEVVRRVISQPGKPLEGAVREEMEQRMGDSFSDVQLHTGPEAAKAASTLEARAFTTGNHVVFNRGEYDPESPEGKYLLAHELAHVRQQTGGAISMLPQEGSSLVIDPDPELEREADEVARKALEGDEPIVAHRLGMEVHIQRAAADDGMLYGAVEDLQEQVDGLEERQSQLMGTMLEAAPGASEDFDVAGAAAKGLAGFGAGAATGAAAGAFLGPGAAVTATGGAVIGAASAIASDVAKEGLGTLMSNRPGGQADKLEGMYLEMAEMYEEFLEAREKTGDPLEGVGKSGAVKP